MARNARPSVRLDPDLFGREIYVTAAHLLANTSTITIVSGIAHVHGRDSIASAQAARTLKELSGGRFVRGLGVSHPIAAQMGGLDGLDWENPVAKMRSHFEGMRDTPLQSPPMRRRTDRRTSCSRRLDYSVTCSSSSLHTIVTSSGRFRLIPVLKGDALAGLTSPIAARRETIER